MGETTIKHSCGHEVIHRHAGDERTQRERVAWLQAQPCQKCFQERQVEASKKLGAEMQLPELQGDEGDCQWAEQIRAKVIGRNKEFCDKLQRVAKKAGDEDKAALAAAIASKDAFESLRHQADAQWWIDNRFDAVNFVRDETASAIQPILDQSRDSTA